MIYNKYQESKEYITEGQYKIQCISQDFEKCQFNEEKHRASEKKQKIQLKSISEDNQKLLNQIDSINDK